MNVLEVKLTAGAADTSVTYAVPPGDGSTAGSGRPINFVSLPFKTTGSAGATNTTYAESTGLLTIACGNNDVIRVCIGID